MADIMEYFKVMLIVQLFFGFAVTMMSYTLPSDALVYISDYTGVSGDIDMQGTSSNIQQNLEQQTNIPIIEVGALVFYSGNMLIDLLLNSLFAVPEMIGLLISGVFSFFNVNAVMTVMLLTFIQVAVSIMYFIGLLQLLTGIRSGRVI